MNKIIQEELKKIKIADISGYSDNTTEFIIPKTTISKFEKGNNYLIELDTSLLVHNPDSILETNYNSNKIPSSKYYHIEVTEILGKIIKCVGVAFNINTRQPDFKCFWNGYLPIDYIKIIEEENNR